MTVLRGTSTSRSEAARLSSSADLTRARERDQLVQRNLLLSDMGTRVDTAEAIVSECSAVSQEDARRLTVLTRAVGELANAVYRGAEVDAELALVGACVVAWREAEMEDR